jgi:hypothetical protein
VPISFAQIHSSAIPLSSAALALLVDTLIAENATLRLQHETRKLYKDGGILPEKATDVNFDPRLTA